MNTHNVATTTIIFAKRAILHTVRTPETIIQTVIFPLVLFGTLLAVFSTAVNQFTAHDEAYAQRLVPALIVAGAMFGSSGSASSLFTDLNNGFFERLQSLSTPWGATLAGMSIAEALRSVIAVIGLTAVGALAGFRFEAGLLHALGFFGFAALAAVTFSWIGLWLATIAKSQESFLPPLTALFLVLLFFSQGMVPLEAYPDAVQPLVQWNPGSAFVVLLDRLAQGGELVKPVLHAIAWAIGIIVVCSIFAVQSLRRR